MSLRIVVDMNLSPEWVPFLEADGHSAVHWSSVGNPTDSDSAIMLWAVQNGHIVFTNDLDFSDLLFLNRTSGPSVLQVRNKLLLPEHIGSDVLRVLRRYQAELATGALVVISENKNRVRILPM